MLKAHKGEQKEKRARTAFFHRGSGVWGRFGPVFEGGAGHASWHGSSKMPALDERVLAEHPPLADVKQDVPPFVYKCLQ